MQNPELHARIMAHDFGGGGQAAFAERLIGSNTGRTATGDTLVRDYLRFVYLTQVSPTPLTPSREVDQVWHFHITETRDYWERFCGAVLGKPLHHDADTSAAARAVHSAQYADTLRLYEREFGEVPPDRFWPVEDKRRRPILGAGLVATGGVALSVGATTGEILGVIMGCFFVLVGLAIMILPTKSAAGGCGASGCGGCGGGGD